MTNHGSCFQRHPKRGLSLLEMILATAILMAGALAVGQLSFITSRHAMRSQDEVIALQIAAYQFEQMELGILPIAAQGVQSVLPENDLLALAEETATTAQRAHVWEDWSYAITIEPALQPGVVQVQLDVFRMPPGDNGASTGLSDSSLQDAPPQPIGPSGDSADSSAAVYHRTFARLFLSSLRSTSAAPDDESLDNSLNSDGFGSPGSPLDSQDSLGGTGL